MLTHDHESPGVTDLSDFPTLPHTYQRYDAEGLGRSLDEQSRLIEQVIRFAYDTLGARHLDVRVVDTDQRSITARTMRRAVTVPSVFTTS